MKKKIRVLGLVVLLSLSQIVYAQTEPPKVKAKGAVLIEQDSGRVLFAQNAETPLAMASTTKIMTCIIALENGKLDDIVVTSKRAAQAPPVKLKLKIGEKQRLGDLLYALMLQSDNDVAVAIAEHIGGSVEAFCELMTQKAKEIGAMQTTFKTPNGLDAEEHGSSAYDMALIAAYALKNPKFVEIVTTTHITIPTVKTENSVSHDLQNKNRFIYSYEGANGVKTGFTNKAGHCFVGGAKRKDMQLIGVALGSGWGKNGKTQKYTDVIQMMNYGFSEYEKIEVITPNENMAVVPVEKAISKTLTIGCNSHVVLPLSSKEKENIYVKKIVPTTLIAPVKKGDTIGEVQVICDGTILAKVPLTANNSIKKANVLDYIRNWLNHQ